jgi:MFS family permease
LLVGLVVASAGGILAVVSVMVASLPLLLVASAAAGFGNASLALSRYAAADMYPVERRASALGFVVWGSTIGAILGPNLVGPAAAVAPSMGLTPMAGAFAATVLFMVVALLVVLLGPRAPIEPHPDQPVQAPPEPGAARASVLALLADLLRQPWGRTAVGALIGAQVVMSMIMTMTPFHLHEHGHDLGVVGFVISAHVLGMFAFAPLSGRLTDRFGPDAMVLAGFGTLTAAGVMAAVMPGGTGALLGLPLFLLGLGWNLAFVAGSSLLARRIVHEQARLQGAVDATIWLAGALSSLSSGLVVALAGYTTLAVTGAALAVVVIGLALVDQRQVRAAAG